MLLAHKGTSVFRAGSEGPLLLCMHGAGHSAMSFATFAKQAQKYSTVVAFDYRGHGNSLQPNTPFDMSIQTLVSQCEFVVEQIKNKYKEKNIIIVGHSLGGSIATRIAVKVQPSQDQQIVGLIVIDVVEGTAIEALPFMTKILNSRPKQFSSVQQAILWSLSSRTILNKESARISIQPQLSLVDHDGSKRFVWKVPLEQSEKHWKGWFEGLSDKFLGVKCSKILFTAQKQRLDSKLMVAQMQGKFRLNVIHNVGHSVQEDDYQATAHAVYDFIKIFKIPPTPAQSKKKIEEGLAKYKPPLCPY